MTQYAIATDLNRCVGCLACSAACKSANEVPIGNFWNKTLRIGPNPTKGGSGQFPDVELYFLTVQCQHCANPACVEVCPTGASHKLEDGTVQIDKSKCIGCQFCAMACPYGVRYLNQDQGVDNFEGPAHPDSPGCQYEEMTQTRVKLKDYVEPYAENDIHHLADAGNEPKLMYLMREGRKWRE